MCATKCYPASRDSESFGHNHQLWPGSEKSLWSGAPAEPWSAKLCRLSPYEMILLYNNTKRALIFFSFVNAARGTTAPLFRLSQGFLFFCFFFVFFPQNLRGLPWNLQFSFFFSFLYPTTTTLRRKHLDEDTLPLLTPFSAPTILL